MPETEVDTDECESLSFKLSHNSVLWASILPKLKLYSTSMTLSSTDTLCKPWCLMWLCLSRLRAEAKTCCWPKNNDPYIRNNIIVLTSSPSHRKRKNTSNDQLNVAKTLPYVMWPQFIFPAELYDSKWQDEKVATAYGWGGINKGTKLIIMKWRQIPPDFTHCLVGTRNAVPHFFPKRIKVMCGTC